MNIVIHRGLGSLFWDFGSSTADRSRLSFEFLLLDVLVLGSLYQKHPDALFSGRCKSWHIQYFQTGFLDVPASSITLLRQPFPSSVVAAFLRPAATSGRFRLCSFHCCRQSLTFRGSIVPGHRVSGHFFYRWSVMNCVCRPAHTECRTILPSRGCWQPQLPCHVVPCFRAS